MTTVLLNTLNKNTEEALKWTAQKQKMAWFTESFPKANWVLVTFTEDEEKLIYSEKHYVTAMGSKVFPFVKEKKGFGVDKKTGKLTMWWGSSVQRLFYVKKLLKATENVWFDDKLLPYITPTVLGKILTKKVTDEEALIKKILSVQRLKMSPDTFLRLRHHFDKFQITVINKAFYNLDNAEIGGLYAKARNVLAMNERLDYEDKKAFEETNNALKMILALDDRIVTEAALW